MKKKIRNGVIGILAVVISLVLFFDLLPMAMHNQKDVKTGKSAEWMSQVPDSMELDDILIPGTHDSCSKYCQMAWFSKCQGQDVSEQLNGGFRYLDIRLESEGEDMVLHHGPAKCRTGVLGKTLTFEMVMKDVDRFLDEHPSETVILNVKKEGGSDSQADFSKRMEEYMKDEHVYQGSSLPTLGQARGKVIMARRYDGNQGIPMYWKDQPGQKVDDGSWVENGELCVQDHYELEKDTKWKVFTDTLKCKEDGLILNFLSTKGKGKLGHPVKYATPLNGRLMEEDLHDARGIIIVDYGTQAVAEKVYKANLM